MWTQTGLEEQTMEQTDLDHLEQSVQANKPELDQRAQVALVVVQQLEQARLAPHQEAALEAASEQPQIKWDQQAPAT